MLIKQQVFQGNQHPNYPLDLLFQELGLREKEEKLLPLVHVAMAMEGLHEKGILESLNADCAISFQLVDQDLLLQFDYNQDLYRESSIQQIFRHVEYYYQQCFAKPNLTLGEILILTEDKKLKM